MDQSVFGRLLAIALDKKVDSGDSDRYKTPKAVLTKHLTVNVKPMVPQKNII